MEIAGKTALVTGANRASAVIWPSSCATGAPPSTQAPAIRRR